MEAENFELISGFGRGYGYGSGDGYGYGNGYGYGSGAKSSPVGETCEWWSVYGRANQ
jgi:hypothetical protein